MRRLIFISILLSIYHLLFSNSVFATNTQTDWPMTAADPQRTSHNNVAVVGNLSVEWYHIIDPYVDPKVQVIAAGGKIFLSTSKGLVTFDANTGSQLWFFGTELPPGNAPTYDSGYVYLPGFDHHIRKIDATNGNQIWISDEAGAGFETNPLVIGNTVYAGNRDGYFYAFDANNGTLKWKYQTGGPIRFSAAISKDNTTVFFASDDSYAYALNTNGILKWKSAKLPGAGFASFWPVVWTDTWPSSSTYGNEFVIFSGSKKASTYSWFGSNTDYYQDNYYINAGCSTGSTSYLWSSNSQVLDCSPIFNFFNNSRPDRRHLIVLRANDGTEYTPYLPVNWSSAPQGGNKFPPVVGADGVLYSTVGYNTGGNSGANGWIAGLKFGDKYIKKIWNDSAAADEPPAFTSGGNMIYWGEGLNHEAWGAVDITKNVGANYYTFNITPIGSSKYCYNSASQQLLNMRFGPCPNNGTANGVYGFYDGTTGMSPIPYNGRLYLVYLNTLIALSPSGGNINKGLVTAPANLNAAQITTTSTEVVTKLVTELQKMINAGHLRPGYYDSGYVARYLDRSFVNAGENIKTVVPGDRLIQYFHSPGDTIQILSEALLYLKSINYNPAFLTQLQNYITSEQNNYPIQTYAHIGWKNGKLREAFDDTNEISAVINNSTGQVPSNPISQIWSAGTNYTTINIGSFPPEAAYAGWKYAQAVNLSGSSLTSLITALKSKLPTASSTSMNDTNMLLWPYILNRYIAGYKGYLELQKMAGQAQDQTVVNEYNRLVSLRVNNFNKDEPWGTILRSGDYYNDNMVLNVARNFMWLTPELGASLNASKFSVVQEAFTDYNTVAPFWFVAKYEQTYEEGKNHPLYDRWALFQARAYILKQPFSELVKYLDVPAFERGDLFYIQNLVAALQAASSGPSPTPDSCPKRGQGDVNCDQFINIADLRLILTNLGGNGLSYDINKDSRVNIFDVGLILANFGK